MSRRSRPWRGVLGLLVLAGAPAGAAGVLDTMLRDPFAVPARIVKAMTAPPPAPARAEPAPPQPVAEPPPPPPPPELRAVMLAGRDSMVNVSGSMVRIGETVAGHRLVEVRARDAVFRRDDGETVTVSLDQPRRGKDNDKK